MDRAELIAEKAPIRKVLGIDQAGERGGTPVDCGHGASTDHPSTDTFINNKYRAGTRSSAGSFNAIQVNGVMTALR